MTNYQFLKFVNFNFRWLNCDIYDFLRAFVVVRRSWPATGLRTDERNVSSILPASNESAPSWPARFSIPSVVIAVNTVVFFNLFPFSRTFFPPQDRERSDNCSRSNSPVVLDELNRCAATTKVAAALRSREKMSPLSLPTPGGSPSSAAAAAAAAAAASAQLHLNGTSE